MDTPLPNPSTLNDIFQMNPGAFQQAQGIIGTGQDFADNSLAQNQQRLDQSQQEQPFRLAQLGLQNQTTQAQLPGVQANSSMLQRKNNNQTITNDADVKDQLAELAGKTTAAHMSQMNDVGTIMQQAGAMAEANPQGAAQYAKQALQQSGHGDMWNPDWENLPGSDMALTLATNGKHITDVSQKLQMFKEQQGMKADILAEQERQKQAGRMALREQIDSTSRAIEAAKEVAKAKLDKPTMEQLAGRYTTMADNAAASGDAESAASLRDKANQTLVEARAIKSAGAGVTTAPKVDIGTLAGIPTVGDAAPPAIGGTPTPVSKGPLKYSTPEGKSWVQRAMQANPGMSEEDVLLQGRKSGKLVD